MLGTWTFTLRRDKMPIIITIMILGFSCSDSSSVDNSVMTFEVTTIKNIAFDEFAQNHTDSFYPITITLIDYEPESDFSGTVNAHKVGTLSIAGKCSGKFDCFTVKLDSSFIPVTHLTFFGLKIDNSLMSGGFIPRGPSIDFFPLEFIASRKE